MPMRWRGQYDIEENSILECNEGPEWIMAKQIYKSLKLGREFTHLDFEEYDGLRMSSGLATMTDDDKTLLTNKIGNRDWLMHVKSAWYGVEKYGVCPASRGFEIASTLDVFQVFNPKGADVMERASNDRAYSLMFELPKIDRVIEDGQEWMLKPGEINFFEVLGSEGGKAFLETGVGGDF